MRKYPRRYKLYRQREFNHNAKRANTILKKHGFNLTAYTTYQFEEVFLFKTDEEATRAYELLEQETHKLVGWWYSLEDFFYILEWDNRMDYIKHVKFFSL